MLHRFSPRTALLVGVAAVVLGSSGAYAQGYPGGPPDYEGTPTEQLYVTAPRFHSESSPLNAPLERVSLSTGVRYDDLDLRTRRGAYELRMRLRDAAHDMCGRLYDAYPFEQANGASCYKTALDNALVRANEAIDDARISYRQYRD